VCDLVTHTTDCEIRPDHYAGLLSGRYRSIVRSIGAASGTGCQRTITGEVKVKMLLVGGKVEGAIVGGLRENGAAQVGLLNGWIASG
jgi:hypothetical protein